MRFRLSLFLLLSSPALFAQHLVPQPAFNAIANEYSGEAAQEFDRQIVQYHRIQGSPMMADVAEKVVLSKLQAWGIESKIEQFPSDGKIRYQTHVSPMGWDMRDGELWVEGVGRDSNFAPFRICRYSDVPMCVSTYSKGGDWSGELVEVGSGTSDADYAGKDVRRKSGFGLRICGKRGEASRFASRVGWGCDLSAAGRSSRPSRYGALQRHLAAHRRTR